VTFLRPAAKQILHDRVVCLVHVAGLSAFVRDKKDPNTYVCERDLSLLTCYKVRSDDSHEIVNCVCEGFL